ncbi:hypothetical protein TDB9533_00669 [Thalassocella blandensis]|nr:hypothetical protein TDB9533_00669 [Thalassocella blandensis]
MRTEKGDLKNKSENVVEKEKLKVNSTKSYRTSPQPLRKNPKSIQEP